jgi:hypothetical protein
VIRASRNGVPCKEGMWWPIFRHSRRLDIAVGDLACPAACFNRSSATQNQSAWLPSAVTWRSSEKNSDRGVSCTT